MDPIDYLNALDKWTTELEEQVADFKSALDDLRCERSDFELENGDPLVTEELARDARDLFSSVARYAATLEQVAQ